MGSSLAAQLEECPAGVRVLGLFYVLTSAGLPALAAAAPRRHFELQPHFVCCLWTVKQRRHLWALLASLFYRPCRGPLDALMAFVELSMASSHLPARERELGTTRFLCWSVLTSCLTNAVFLAMMQGLSAVGSKSSRGWSWLSNQGLWPLLMTCVTVRSLRLPNAPPANVLGVVDVPHRWYPLSLSIGLSLLGGSVQWDSFAALCYAYVSEAVGLDKQLLPSRRSCERFEGLLAKLGVFWRGRVLGGAWVPAPGDAQGPRSGGRRHDQDFGARDGGGGNIPLFGGRGYRLGD
eukprot:TRINITY_DN57350_c0_g1_i1.p1 TRINITY_DN57350_c0_g1~~TRINITY_DN57350_c0_g1_i1.p1  ORF type:complete len:311 (-),score=54.70 TRINITY_DN57350_c0_g1_i1:52-927(-)